MTSSLPAASDAPPPGRAALNAPPKGATSHQTAENAPLAPTFRPSGVAPNPSTERPRDLPPPERAAYLLDFDGTLVDIAPAPDLVTVDPTLPATLRALCRRTGGAVAIVTGRPIAQVDALLADTVTAIAGEHGTALRHQPGGPIETITLPAIPPHWRTAAQVAIDAHPGTLFEPKRHGFVLHYRARPDAGPPLLILLRALLAEQPGYELMAAKMAWEIRPRGREQGHRRARDHAPPALCRPHPDLYRRRRHRRGRHPGRHCPGRASACAFPKLSIRRRTFGPGSPDRPVSSKKASSPFSRKRTKKLLLRRLPKHRGCIRRRIGVQKRSRPKCSLRSKSFLVFFSKKDDLLT